MCVICGVKPQRPNGMGGFKNKCRSCYRKAHEPSHGVDPARLHETLRPYTASKGPVCERCGFVPEHSCQLDVDHIDGDHDNDAPDNLQTLCANCHRLKSRAEKIAKVAAALGP